MSSQTKIKEKDSIEEKLQVKRIVLQVQDYSQKALQLL